MYTPMRVCKPVWVYHDHLLQSNNCAGQTFNYLQPKTQASDADLEIKCNFFPHLRIYLLKINRLCAWGLFLISNYDSLWIISIYYWKWNCHGMEKQLMQILVPTDYWKQRKSDVFVWMFENCWDFRKRKLRWSPVTNVSRN